MKNKVLIFDDSQNLISKTALKMEKFLTMKGLFDFSFLTSSDFEEFESVLKEQRKEETSVIVICQNDKLDECLETVKKDDDKLSLVDEQAIKLENESQALKMLFVPFELEFEKFLDGFFEEKNVFVYAVFGKSRGFVCGKFEEFKSELGCDYKIITKHPYLHIVYCSQEVSAERVDEAFGQSVFSNANESLAEKLNKILSEKGKTLSVVEYGTYGNVACDLNCQSSVLKTEDELKKFGVSKEILEGENAGKEVVFALSKKVLSKQASDLVLSVCDKIGDEEKTYVSVGDKQVVHLYSSVFVSEAKERFAILQDFAIFRLICFLNGKE